MVKLREVKAALLEKQKKETHVEEDYLSTSSTLFNLALTGNPFRGFKKGEYYFIVGDSNSGKTFVSMSCMAEASINPAFDNYRFICDFPEGGALMNLRKFFGRRVVERIEPPAKDKNGNPVHSQTIEDFYDNLDDNLDTGSILQVLDSENALSSQDEQAKFKKNKSIRRKAAAKQRGETTAAEGDDDTDEKQKGSYGDGKAKKHSQLLRQLLLTRLRETQSIFIIISQTRDRIGIGGMFNPKTRSGGRALKFYAAAEIWTSPAKKIYKSVRGKPRQVGVIVKIAIEKNRLTGKEWSIEIPIYWSYGIDDLGSCVDFLTTEKHWKNVKGRIEAPEFDFKGYKDQLIQKIQEDGRERKLRIIVGKVWREIEQACTLKRKPRYD
jgi:RecA/RadA recombinase